MSDARGSRLLSAEEVLSFLEDAGVALESARGPVPALTRIIVGADIRGSWWGHPDGNAIHDTLEEVRESGDVLVCRLVGGKVTYVHRRLWPALVVLADDLGDMRLAAVASVHMPDGHHERVETPLGDWLDDDTVRLAEGLTRAQARELLPPGIV